MKAARNKQQQTHQNTNKLSGDRCVCAQTADRLTTTERRPAKEEERPTVSGKQRKKICFSAQMSFLCYRFASSRQACVLLPLLLMTKRDQGTFVLHKEFFRLLRVAFSSVVLPNAINHRSSSNQATDGEKERQCGTQSSVGPCSLCQDHFSSFLHCRMHSSRPKPAAPPEGQAGPGSQPLLLLLLHHLASCSSWA